MNITRRTFTLRSIVGTATLATVDLARAQEAMLLETQSQARALGYKSDAAKVEVARFPKYVTGQNCASCQMFRPRQPDTGSCAIFPGKQVSANGWCDAFVARA